MFQIVLQFIQTSELTLNIPNALTKTPFIPYENQVYHQDSHFVNLVFLLTKSLNQNTQPIVQHIVLLINEIDENKSRLKGDHKDTRQRRPKDRGYEK